MENYNTYNVDIEKLCDSIISILNTIRKKYSFLDISDEFVKDFVRTKTTKRKEGKT